jgi:Dyp-type peroxidase family
VEQPDLQGNVLCGYGNAFAHGLYAFIHVGEAAAGRELLAELVGRITDAVPWRENGRSFKPRHTVNVALSYRGLVAFGVRDEILRSFPPEFRAGMARRAELLGDTGPSDPRHWEEGLRPGTPHILVTIMAQTAADRRGQRDELRARIEEAGEGLSMAYEQNADLLGRPGEKEATREHFGFADGLSQPTIKDERAGPNDLDGRGTPKRLGRWDGVAPGEFVLGYADEQGAVATSPQEPLCRNGSYMVVRKLRQDVAAFNAYLSEAAGRTGLSEELLAAKVVGRWRSGAPLSLASERDNPELTLGGEEADRMNDFRYGSDVEGRACPIGSHIRRANPRDALGWHGKLTKRRRIIRRGMPYGPSFEERPEVQDRGLMFVCYQASISRQFEFIQARWLNDGDAFGLGSEKDPLANQDPGGKLTIQGKSPTFLAALPSFVSTRGGGYFFVPGIRALGALAAGELGRR